MILSSRPKSSTGTVSAKPALQVQVADAIARANNLLVFTGYQDRILSAQVIRGVLIGVGMDERDFVVAPNLFHREIDVVLLMDRGDVMLCITG